MSDPITAMAVGAAIGGGTSLARGKSFGSALQNAAIGGALGGGGSYLGGLMGGAGATGAASGASSGSGLLSSLQGVATTPVSMGTGGFASGIGGQVIPNVAANIAPIASTASTVPFGSTEFISPYTKEGITNFADGTASTFAPDYLSSGAQYAANAPSFSLDKSMLGKSADFTGGGYNPSFFGRMGDMIGNPLSSLSTSDKVGIGLKGFDALNQPQTQTETAPVMPIKQGNPDMVSTPLYNVAPNVGMQEGNELGLPNLLSRMPLTEEELLRLQQQMQTTGFRGR
jgi:hypothetical protein